MQIIGFQRGIIYSYSLKDYKTNIIKNLSNLWSVLIWYFLVKGMPALYRHVLPSQSMLIFIIFSSEGVNLFSLVNVEDELQRRRGARRRGGGIVTFSPPPLQVQSCSPPSHRLPTRCSCGALPAQPRVLTTTAWTWVWRRPSTRQDKFCRWRQELSQNPPKPQERWTGNHRFSHRKLLLLREDQTPLKVRIFLVSSVDFLPLSKINFPRFTANFWDTNFILRLTAGDCVFYVGYTPSRFADTVKWWSMWHFTDY